MNEILAVFAVMAIVVVFGGRLVNERVFGWITSATLAIIFAISAANEDSAWRWVMLAAAVASAVEAVQVIARNRRTTGVRANASQ